MLSDCTFCGTHFWTIDCPDCVARERDLEADYLDALYSDEMARELRQARSEGKYR